MMGWPMSAFYFVLKVKPDHLLHYAPSTSFLQAMEQKKSTFPENTKNYIMGTKLKSLIEFDPLPVLFQRHAWNFFETEFHMIYILPVKVY